MSSRRRRNLIFLLSVTLLAVCCIGGIVGASRLYHQVSTAPQELRAAAMRYLDAVQAGDLDRAYQQLCGQARAHESLDTFRSRTKQLASYQILGIQVAAQNGQTRGLVATRLTLVDNAVTDQTIPFVNEQQQWRPCEP